MESNNNRRNFLKSVGTLSLGAAIISPLSALPNTKLTGESDLAKDIDTSKPQTISILQTTDVHCQIHPHDELFWENEKAVFRKTGGYAYIATLLKELKKKNPNTYTIDTGDMFQGSELSVETTGAAFVPILNALSYDLYLPGNWEVIYGKKRMQTLLGSLDAPKICTNMYHDLGEGKRGELIFQPYDIWHVAGAKIGFLGYTDPLVPIRQSPNYSKGIIYTPPEDNLPHYVDVLRNQEQCSYVIIIAHLGLSQQIALANKPECEGVNYILGGDTHERVRKPIVCKYSKVVEPGAFGSFIGKLDLTILDGKVISDSYELIEVASPKIKPDPKIANLLKEKESVYQEQINTVVGYSTIPLYRYFVVENPIDTMILSALHWKFPEIDINLSNGFRFCPPKTTPDETGNIPITNGFVFDMLPVDSTVRTAKVSGKQLINWLEKELNNVFATDASKRFGGWVVKFKGMEVQFNAFAEMGTRVQSITVKNVPIDPEKMYSIMACERDGDPEDMLCRMKGVIDPKNTTSTLHSVLKEYLKKNSPVTPTPQKNAIILDAPETLLTQVSGVDYTFR
ncbi:5'-nucleotidase C-terminal domain-containing protein [Flavobacterium sp. F-380]|uniref:5'-nucleotidase C-terminal domain-containing protein n=1 Tax=Flavobacterium kayseriense TaxID=2764714 RepID=A0ABR7J8A6_9FLAO|nr:5'-nucleotidase C-terminal domain-containing protein [Flavobacterium kayseriense]MBC5841773.1 5'-nucleotidase C-terminal domain-containing protein [Flavobacterium kayseriense]MBC5848302.1 5'-nucleotidase C-terminal domain-containing protein [Flavobacterium kayseriense]